MSVAITKEYDVMVNIVELIGATEYYTIDEMSLKPMSW
jgi:hypothetical protein